MPETHVMPLEDLHHHHSGMQCPCRPEKRQGELIVHNAWDGREAFEMVTGELFRGREWVRIRI